MAIYWLYTKKIKKNITHYGRSVTKTTYSEIIGAGEGN